MGSLYSRLFESKAEDNTSSVLTAKSTEEDFKYALEERLLCYHKALIYSAKCLKRRKVKNRKNQYFIHYIGWNQKWDEWVGEDSLLKLNDHNLKIQLRMSAEYKKDNTSSLKKRKSDDSNETNNKRHKNDNISSKNSTNVKERENSLTNNKKNQLIPTFDSKPGIAIKIPKQLKQCLDEDRDQIIKHRKLIVLPPNLTVKHILENYLKERMASKLSPTEKSQVLDVIKVINKYFDEMLCTRLLYCSERTQYKQLLAKNPNKRMSEMYGSIHLLRLFLIFDHFLASNAFDENSHQLLVIESKHLLMYLCRNREIFEST